MCTGGGPVLGGGSRGVGQPRAAAAPNEAPGGMSQDVSGAMFCGEYKHCTGYTHWSERIGLFYYVVFCRTTSHYAGLIRLKHLLMKGKWFSLRARLLQVLAKLYQERVVVHFLQYFIGFFVPQKIQLLKLKKKICSCRTKGHFSGSNYSKNGLKMKKKKPECLQQKY